MRCTNEYCVFSWYGICCHEDEKAYAVATPNELDCPVSTRRDIEQQLYAVAGECIKLLEHRNMREIVEIKKFIEMQRYEKNVIDSQ